MHERKTVGVIGATSLVGQCLLPLLIQTGFQVIAFSRRLRPQSTEDVIWQSAAVTNNASLPAYSPDESTNKTGSATLPSQTTSNQASKKVIPNWICLAPIWVLPEYFQTLQACGAKRVIALSSTSRFTKSHSPDDAERILAQRLIASEDQLQTWAEQMHIEWVILRPTLIYGLGKDKNINEITRLIRRFGFFPLIGQAKGLRQPVHAEDVARASLSCLSAATVNKSYNLSGGETLAYKDMVERVFIGLGRKPFFIKVPKHLMQLLLMILRCFPRFRSWKPAMAERMNQDLIFDHQAATRDLNFSPRPFQLEPKDFC